MAENEPQHRVPPHPRGHREHHLLGPETTAPGLRGVAAGDVEPGEVRDPYDSQPRTLGLPQATALVLGTIIGVGIFNLPSSLAPFGPISIVSLGLTTVGALALALLFAGLSRRMPADGGPYAYARSAFGNFWGFSNAWLYWITTCSGNAAVAVGWVLYVEHFVNTGRNPWFGLLLSLAGLWAATLINLRGVASMGRMQLITSVLKWVPLAVIGLAGLFFIDLDNFEVWNVSGQSVVTAIGSAMALCLFSYIGVESAAVAAATVKDPARNVPRATIIGTLLTAVVYLLALVAIFGIVPNAALQATNAPFALAAELMTGATWMGSFMAGVVVISGFGALNGWTMLTGEMPFVAAEDGVFPRRFASLSAHGVPAFAIVLSALLASGLLVVAHIGDAGIAVFNTLVLMTGVTGAIPYAFSALAQIRWRLADGRTITRSRLIRDLTIAGIALAFSALFIWYSSDVDASGWARYQPYLVALGAYLIGIPVYWANRGSMTAPAPVPPAVDAIDPVPGR